MSYNYCIKKRRKGKHLSYEERQELEIYILENEKAPKKKRLSQREIARRMGVSPSTICREIKRGAVQLRDSEYREYISYSCDIAQDDYDDKAQSKGPNLKIGKDYAFAEHVRQKIVEQKYSPNAVLLEIRTGKYTFETNICTKTLYNYIDRDIFWNVSNKDLPREGRIRKRRYRRVRASHRSNGGKSITKRPIEAEERSEYGHWEMDCIESGKNKGRSCLLVMVERMTRETILFKLRAQTQEEVLKRLDRLERRYGIKEFMEKFKTITVDNGSEFKDWESLEKGKMRKNKRRTQIYFCHPYCSWERGSNEQRNGEIRRHVPKGSAISEYSHKEIQEIEDWLNNYPRKVLEGYSARDRLKALGVVA